MLGKWNKSVIITYIGMLASVFGMYIAISAIFSIKYVFVCFIIAGVCDLFDGFFARKCKRTEEEKAFGIQIDSLADVVSFVVFPVVLLISLGLNQFYHVIIYFFYTIFGIARLGHFNISIENTSEPVKYYEGLPVTSVALLYPIAYLLNLFMEANLFKNLLSIMTIIISILFISKIKIKKPRGVAYIFFSLLAISVICIYIFLL